MSDYYSIPTTLGAARLAAAANNGQALTLSHMAYNYVGGFPQQFAGYIDEFRLRKEAVYTGNFTPPTAPFTF